MAEPTDDPKPTPALLMNLANAAFDDILNARGASRTDDDEEALEYQRRALAHAEEFVRLCKASIEQGGFRE